MRGGYEREREREREKERESLSSKEMFMKHVRFRVGKGDKILFWINLWVGDFPLQSPLLNYSIARLISRPKLSII